MIQCTVPDKVCFMLYADTNVGSENANGISVMVADLGAGQQAREMTIRRGARRIGCNGPAVQSQTWPLHERRIVEGRHRCCSVLYVTLATGLTSYP